VGACELKNAWKFSKGPPRRIVGKTKLIISLTMEYQRLLSFVLTITLLEFPAFFKSAGQHCSGRYFWYFCYDKSTSGFFLLLQWLNQERNTFVQRGLSFPG
jgi:hypothetical protein